MRCFSARVLVALSFCLAGVSTPVFAVYGTTENKESFQPKAQVSATNGILTVIIENSSTSDLGEFTVRTGASHPHPNQDVLYPVGTSYITLRDVTSQEVWADSGSGGGNLGAGFTFQGQGMTFSAPGTEAFKQDFARWEDMRRQATTALDRAESALSKKLQAQESKDRLAAGVEDKAPSEYQKQVDIYFKALAAKKKQ